MSKQPLSTEFLRPDGQIVLHNLRLGYDAMQMFETLGIRIANVSSDFITFYNVYVHNRNVFEPKVLNVGTMRQRMPGDWLAAFYYWAGVPLPAFIAAVACQGSGQKGDLLTNGKLNGAIMAEEPQYAATCRWHDPSRPYPEQTATFPKLGWSFHVVHVGSQCWCPQGGRILYV